MKKLLIGLLGATFASPALATGITVKPLLDLRLRWENVDQDGIAREANAVTLRARTGAEITLGDFRLLGEAESTMPFVERYFSGLNAKTQFPLVADPGNFELNRFQLQYRGVKNLVVTAGRQRINIEDQRFVGSVSWRQNESPSRPGSWTSSSTTAGRQKRATSRASSAEPTSSISNSSAARVVRSRRRSVGSSSTTRTRRRRPGQRSW